MSKRNDVHQETATEILALIDDWRATPERIKNLPCGFPITWFFARGVGELLYRAIMDGAFPDDPYMQAFRDGSEGPSPTDDRWSYPLAPHLRKMASGDLGDFFCHLHDQWLPTRASAVRPYVDEIGTGPEYRYDQIVRAASTLAHELNREAGVSTGSPDLQRKELIMQIIRKHRPSTVNEIKAFGMELEDQGQRMLLNKVRTTISRAVKDLKDDGRIARDDDGRFRVLD